MHKGLHALKSSKGSMIIDSLLKLDLQNVKIPVFTFISSIISKALNSHKNTCVILLQKQLNINIKVVNLEVNSALY